MKTKHDAGLAAHLVFVVRIEQTGDHDPVNAGRRLDHIRQIALVGLRVQVGEILAGPLLVLPQVVVGAIGDALQLSPAEREEVLHVGGRLGVVGELVLVVRAQAQALWPQAEDLEVPAMAGLDPVAMPSLVVTGLHKELHLHLLELSKPKDEVPRRDLVPEAAALLGDTEGHPDPHRVEDVLEVHEHPLGGLRPQVHVRPRPLDRADVGLEHEVELARLRERASAVGAAVAAQVVGTPALLAFAEAVDHGVCEAGDVPGGHPDLGVHDHRALQADHVLPELDHVPPPEVADVAPERHSVVTVVVDGVDPAVDLAGLENETAPLAERGHLLHQVCSFPDHA